MMSTEWIKLCGFIFHSLYNNATAAWLLEVVLIRIARKVSF